MLAFDNVPSFSHLPNEADRRVALEQHKDFERHLHEQHPGILHEAVSGPNPLRQQLAFLITLYCTKHSISYETLKQSVIDSNADPNLEGLFKRDNHGDTGKITVNLHALDTNSLRRVYLQIPQAFRKPKPLQNTWKEESTKSDDLNKPVKYIMKKKRNKKIKFTWICCDSCSKWRRLYNHDNRIPLPDVWTCTMHPLNITCDEPADEMLVGETVTA